VVQKSSPSLRSRTPDSESKKIQSYIQHKLGHPLATRTPLSHTAFLHRINSFSCECKYRAESAYRRIHIFLQTYDLASRSSFSVFERVDSIHNGQSTKGLQTSSGNVGNECQVSRRGNSHSWQRYCRARSPDHTRNKSNQNSSGRLVHHKGGKAL
jgi:hypothetical protein